ncbi:MAG: alpha/beta fold hydrolase [Porticoccaceae bacterium]
MNAKTEPVEIQVEKDTIAGTVLTPEATMPGILFVHGWGGSQQRDLERAEKIAGLGCLCLTFDLRGHEKTMSQRQTVTRAHNLADVLAAYDYLAAEPAVDKSAIAVIGTSYGGYLSAILTTLRPVRWLALRAPALYWDEEWDVPKQLLDRSMLASYRRVRRAPTDNQALSACERFHGDVLVVESESDDFVPHATIISYRSAFTGSHSMTHRIIDGADHGLSTDRCQQAYSSILHQWISEMIIGSRISDPLASHFRAVPA